MIAQLLPAGVMLVAFSVGYFWVHMELVRLERMIGSNALRLNEQKKHHVLLEHRIASLEKRRVS